MAGVLEALVVVEAFDELPKVDLNQGWTLIPLTENVQKQLGSQDRPLRDFEKLTSGVIQCAERASANSTAIYVHSEFHGGTGFQAAACWRDGSLSFGPVFTANHLTGMLTERYEVVGLLQMAINQCLRRAGVDRLDCHDEFEALGLVRFRWTDDWASAIT